MVRILYEGLGEGDLLVLFSQKQQEMQICPKSLSNDFAVALACASLSHTWEVTKTFSQARILLWGGQAEMERNPG